MDECIFCKIAKKELPAHMICENDGAVAFLDISPVNEGHALVIPKKHSKNIFDIDEESLLEVQKLVHKLAPAIKSASDACGLNIMQNNEACAGQVVEHMHVHIIPRKESDNLKLWHGKAYESDESSKEMLEKIKKAL